VVRKNGAKKVSKVRGGTLGYRGLPSIEVLGSAFDEYPIKGRRISKIIQETDPSWDDVVKVIEGRER
jgi:hypothetical protein